MRFINPKATIRYVLEQDRALPAEEQTIFRLSQLTAEEDAILQDALAQGMGRMTLMALHLGLAGIEGSDILKRDDSKAFIVPGKRPWHVDGLSQIPREARDELAAVIFKGVHLLEAEAKNS